MPPEPKIEVEDFEERDLTYNILLEGASKITNGTFPLEGPLKTKEDYRIAEICQEATNDIAVEWQDGMKRALRAFCRYLNNNTDILDPVMVEIILEGRKPDEDRDILKLEESDVKDLTEHFFEMWAKGSTEGLLDPIPTQD